MSSSIRLSQQGLRVLRIFLDAFIGDARAELAGADLMGAAQISSGTLYPILLRFEQAGLLESRWERERPEKLGRPRRRFYRRTQEGARVAQKALDDLSSLHINAAVKLGLS